MIPEHVLFNVVTRVPYKIFEGVCMDLVPMISVSHANMYLSRYSMCKLHFYHFKAIKIKILKNPL